MARATLLLAAIALAAASVQATYDCSKQLDLGDARFDLSSLKGEHHFETSYDTPPTVTKTLYQVSVCEPLPSPSSDEDCAEGTFVCMKTRTTRSGLEDRIISVTPVASLIDQDPTVGYMDDNDKDVRKGWLLKMGGGKYNGVDQRAEIEMVCDSGAKETTPTFKEYDPKQGLLSLKWISAAACSTRSDGDSDRPPSDGGNEDKDKDGNDSNSSKSSDGMGFFGWFFTLLFLGFVAYFVIGSWHNYTQYGATGLDAIPHRDMWRDLPYVVSDLFKGRGGSRSGYSALG